MKVRYTIAPLLMILIFGALSASIPSRYADATHTTGAAPPGGIYNSIQLITLESTEPAAIIYYTLNGSEPTTSASEFIDPIIITTNTTLKFFSADPSDNHTSAVVTEEYTIDMSQPFVIDTNPKENSTRVDPLETTFVNATFSEPMDEASINSDSFIVFFGGFPENTVNGEITYDSDTNTATFNILDQLFVGTTYTVALKQSIADQAGNNLPQDFVWNFATGGQFSIFLSQVGVDDVGLAGSAFTITPNPFTLEGSLTVQDNDPDLDSDVILFGEVFDGLISIRNVELSSYLLTEDTVPVGFEKIYDHVRVTVHETKPDGIVGIQNRDLSISIQDFSIPIRIPPPDLTNEQFQIYESSAFLGIFSGRFGEVPGGATEILVVGPDVLPPAAIATSGEALDSLLSDSPFALIFIPSAPEGTPAQQLFDDFQIPIYPDPEVSISDEIVYFVPAYVIPFDDSENNFILTPVIKKVYPGMTLLMNQRSFVSSEVAQVERLNMTFNIEGNDVGFSFGITDTPPPDTPEPPLDAPALFLDVGFVGDINFSDPNAFDAPPKIDILVNKTLEGFEELPDGCSDFVMLLFDEEENEWVEMDKLRTPTLDTGDDTPEDPSDDQCGFTLQPPHFSKFAVGGVRGQEITTEGPSRSRQSNGGGGGPTSIQQMTSGSDIESETKVGSDSVLVRFDYVQPGSGQLKISTVDIDRFEYAFAEMSNLNGDKIGIVETEGSTFITAGNVFNIDVSAIEFLGMAKVTVPYDEKLAQLLGDESHVRILHYDESEEIWHDITSAIDNQDNTVTGMTGSLSPVVAAVVDDGTLPTIYFDINPLNKVRSESSFKSITNQKGLEIQVPIMIKNVQRIDQNYTAIVQILDVNGIARYIDWHSGSLAKSGSAELRTNWTPEDKGHYTIEVFVWDDLDNPLALSSVAKTSVEVI